MDEGKKAELREKLESFHKWPSLYMFKFIIPNEGDKLAQVKAVFSEKVEYATKESSSGRFVSLTVKEMIMDADSVFDRYERVGQIGGVISL
jgi:putative lipoic acid-binding regulatory protein